MKKIPIFLQSWSGFWTFSDITDLFTYVCWAQRKHGDIITVQMLRQIDLMWHFGFWGNPYYKCVLEKLCISVFVFFLSKCFLNFSILSDFDSYLIWHFGKSIEWHPLQEIKGHFIVSTIKSLRVVSECSFKGF